MLLRLLRRGKGEGLNAMFTPPGASSSRLRPIASRVRSYLYARTSYGQLIDVVQAFFSGISCALFIVVAYLSIEPEGVAATEDFFTVYFGIDFLLRLWLAQDSLTFYFSLVSVSTADLRPYSILFQSCHLLSSTSSWTSLRLCRCSSYGCCNHHKSLTASAWLLSWHLSAYFVFCESSALFA
jgi:hypothetical protein